ncbi:MAG: hypothetical protein IPM99_18475 [Rubrivivax sp.]|nr:hypothetical protein [Rubrivivax sp.]
MTQDEYEAETIRLALAGDADAGRAALSLCREALDARSISPRLAQFLADRLWAIDQALDEAERLREIKTSSGSIRSARDAAIAEALCIKRQAVKPRDPFPDWQRQYAAFGTLLLKAGLRPEKVKAAMDEARRHNEGPDTGLDRRTAERMLAAYAPMRDLDNELLMHLAGPLREIVPTYLPQAKSA